MRYESLAWYATHLVNELVKRSWPTVSNTLSILIKDLFCAEKGEVLSDHYKLLPVDLRDIQKLDDVIAMANMDPRYVQEVISSFFAIKSNFITMFLF